MFPATASFSRVLQRSLTILAVLTLLDSPFAISEEISKSKANPEVLLSRVRQLTFEGRRAGEGYFSRDGKWMVFQSERDPGNPFYQIHLLDLSTGDIQRVSNGIGKTTCAWMHPDLDRVLFASTHEDPDAVRKQKEELDFRATGKERRYAWDYDPEYELYLWRRSDGSLTRLTQAVGYDAEGSLSPDGNWIVFASNRHAYSTKLDETQQAQFQHDPSVELEIYRMRIDGSGLSRLTHARGYDGGPFFDPQGERICFRRFSEDGALAEIYTMAADGSDPRQLTRLGAMSWAPYYHPSGHYLIFTTNLQGFSNFELYLVPVQGGGQPVRVTYSEGFDGLASFSPDGTQLTWTSNRTSSKQSQIFLADWDHERAMQLLGLSSEGSSATASLPDAPAAGQESARSTARDIQSVDLLRHIDYLCRPELEGRLTGTPGEQLATAYVASFFDTLGLRPSGDQGTFFQSFEFTAGVSLGPGNRLRSADRDLILEQDWRPLAFSSSGPVEVAPVVFAGYGIVAPSAEEQEAYDSFTHLDVKDKWLMVLRFLPEDIPPERRQHLARYSSLRYKAMVARDRGARGLIVVSGPRVKVRDQLVPLQSDGSLGDSSLPLISVSNAVAAEWLRTANLDLEEIQRELDQGQPRMGVELPEVQLTAEIAIERVKRQGRNVLGRLVTGSDAADQDRPVIIVGAHIDHLGRGTGATSLAREEEQGQIHFGADDNASGVAAMLEIAQALQAEVAQGELHGNYDVLFAAWSGEELGLLGSAHFVKNWVGNRSAGEQHPSTSIYPSISACLNLDMVGRLEKKLVLQGVGSSSVWMSEIERRNAPIGLPITLQNDGLLPTDASSFYTRGVPILSAFTGSHSEYHTPRDTPDRLNYDSMADVARLFALITRSLVQREEAPDFIEAKQAEANRPRAILQAYLGTMPDYTESEISGVKLGGVKNESPAQKAGIRADDIIVELAGKKITNIYDYTYAIEALKIGEPVTVVVLRDGERIQLTVVPGSRQ